MVADQHWDIRPQMKELDIEAIAQYAKEQYPEARRRIISDNGPGFIANDFKSFARLSGMTHVRVSPYYPQSNGKLERYPKTLKSQCNRPKCPCFYGLPLVNPQGLFIRIESIPAGFLAKC
jgi:transposase InsO family protein